MGTDGACSLSPISSSSWTRIAARRDAANARLIRIKAALLRDAPELNAFRLLANSNPLSARRRAVADRTDGRPDFAGIWRPTVRSGCAPSATFTRPAPRRPLPPRTRWRSPHEPRLYVVVDVGGGQRRAAREGWNVRGRSGPRGELADVPQRRRCHGGASAEIAAAFATAAARVRRWRRSNDASRISRAFAASSAAGC